MVIWIHQSEVVFSMIWLLYGSSKCS